MSNEIKGRQVWVTRNSSYEDYDVWRKCPKWRSCESWVGALGGDSLLTTICPELFTKWLGTKPTAKLARGGPKAIEKATLYVALDWGHDE